MKKLITATTIAFVAMCGTANAQTAPLAFSFYPAVRINSALAPECYVGNGGEYAYFLGNSAILAKLPPFIGVLNSKTYFAGPICINETTEPMYPTGKFFMWTWNRDAAGVINANAFDVDCVAKTFQRKFTASGTTEAEIVSSTVSSIGALSAIGGTINQMHAANVCAVMEFEINNGIAHQ